MGGTFAAVAALAAVQRARHHGVGEDIDFSLHECLTIAGCTYADLMQRLSGQPLRIPHRTVEIPSIEPTANGWVGFNTNSRAQYQAFLALIERPDLIDDAELASVAGRKSRMDEWNELVRSWTRRHTTEDIVARASRLRIPVAPVCDGASVVDQEHFSARGVFVPNPDGSFVQPRPPYLINGSSPAIRSKAPALGARFGSHRGSPEHARPSGWTTSARRCRWKASGSSIARRGGRARPRPRCWPCSEPTSSTWNPSSASMACA